MSCKPEILNIFLFISPEFNFIHSVREISSFFFLFEVVWQIIKGPSATVPFPAEKPITPLNLNIINNYGSLWGSVYLSGKCTIRFD